MKKPRFATTASLASLVSLILLATISPVFASGSWTLGASMPTAVEGYGGSSVGTIHFYIAGFHFGDTNLNQRYDTSSNAWLSNGALIPGTNRSELGAVAIGRFVYAVGGRSFALAAVLNSLQRYDPVMDSWVSLAPMPTALATEHSVVTHGGLIYVAGGRTSTSPGSGGAVSLLQIYEITSNTWSLGPPLPMNVSDAAAIVQDNKIFVFGGFSAGAVPTVLATTMIFDISANTWSLGMPMPTPRADASVGICGDKIHVVGGVAPLFTAVHEVYDPATNTWSTATPIPGGATGSGTEVQAISDGGRIFIAGGGIGGSGSFDPTQNIWHCD